MAVQFKFDFDRALAAMVYIASKADVTGLDTYKMCKLVFLSDKLHTVRFGRPITGDSIRAMKFGPVPSATYDILKAMTTGYENARVQALSEHVSVDHHYQEPRFQMTQPIDFSYFLSVAEMSVIDEVVAAHGRKSFGELYNLTHNMPAYITAWTARGTSSNPLMDFEELFENDSEAVAGTKEDMVEDFEIRQALSAA